MDECVYNDMEDLAKELGLTSMEDYISVAMVAYLRAHQEENLC